MPQRKEFTEQQNDSIKEDEKVIENFSKERFHHSTDISSGEGDKSAKEKRKSKKKVKLGKRSNSSGSSSEESEKEGQRIKTQTKDTTKQSIKLKKSLPAAQIKEENIPVIRQIEETLPVKQQNEEDLPTIQKTEGTLPKVQSSQTKTHEVTTKLLNNFFQRDSVEKEEMSGQEQKKRWLVDWWVGTRILPLVEHSVKDEEKIIGQRQCPSKLSWGAGIWAALWLLWLAVSCLLYTSPSPRDS